MNAVDVLEARIEQLEAKLGLTPYIEVVQQGDTAVENLVNAASCLSTATAGQPKLAEAALRATELDNYTDPRYVENLQQQEMQAQVVEASAAELEHHCKCMRACQKAAPAFESEAIQQVPILQGQVDKLQEKAASLKKENDSVGHGIQELAQSCGTAASNVSDNVMSVARKVETTEAKLFPKRRNGLD